jgi:iron complex outermembrane recepter protein
MGTPVACRVWAFALGGALLILFAPGSTALAQEQEPEPAQEQQEAVAQAEERSFEEEITVTGSLIPRPTLEAMAPVTVLEPEEITYRGITRLEDLLTTLPQVFVAQNSTVSNGATGTATVDLRHLGEVRTLVLVNGRRLPVGDAFATVADLNFIPAALVKRVDVLTGGACTAYGADAVAGVVNFVLDTDFEGFRGGVEYGVNQHDNRNELAQAINAEAGFDYPTGSVWDGDIASANAALGGKFADGKGHASVYLDYRHTAAVTKDKRDYTNCAMDATSNGPVCSGSEDIPAGWFSVYDRDFFPVGDYVLDLPSGDQLRLRAPSDVYNYAPYNYMQRLDERWLGGGFVNYVFNPHVEGYAEVMLMDDSTEAQIAPSGDFGSTEVLNCDNPMLSPQEHDLLCTQAGYGDDEYANVAIHRRSVESGNRYDALRHTAWRLLAGARGEINQQWSYDVYGLHAEVQIPESYHNDLSVERMADALDVVGDPDDPSTWRCRSGNEGCVPWNIFEAGGVTQEAVDYLRTTSHTQSRTKTEILDGRLNGDLEGWGWKLPGAAEGIQVALGALYRKENLVIDPDEVARSGDAAGTGGIGTQPVDGSYSVAELYLEGLIPVVQDSRWARDLSLEVGYRYSDYNLAGSHPTWKAQLSYAPIEDLKLRGGVAHATRTPNVVELFTPLEMFQGGFDPCAGSDPLATLEMCVRTGVTPEQYGHLPVGPSGVNVMIGGNPELDPETADTLTVGIVLTPHGAPGLSTAIDYYDIQMEETIGRIGAWEIWYGCAIAGDSFSCSQIHRDQFGSLWITPDGYVHATNQNVGMQANRGIDVNFSYLLPVGTAGILNLGLVGTYLLENSVETPVMAYDCAGYFGDQCGAPNSWWRHRFVAAWETTFDTVFSLGWRLIGPATNDDASPNPDLEYLEDPDWIEALEASGSYEFHAYSYFDLSATYDVTSGIQLTAGINNIFDIEPPLGPARPGVDYGAGYGGTYDPWGRFIYTSMRFTF